MKTVRNNTQFDGIQALRLIAALLVVITHSTFYTHERLSNSVAVWSPGAIGVDIFFIISGFVMMITADKFLASKDGWKEFAARRVLRIVPMYWLATSIKLATMIVLPAAILHAELDPVNIILSYLFLPSTNVDGNFEPLLGVGWTLIFEMFFYSIFAIAIAARAPLIKFVGSLLLLCCLISFFREPDWPAGTIYFSPIVVFFLIGMAFAKWTVRGQPSILVAAGITGLITTISISFLFDIQIASKAKNLIGVCFASFVVLTVIGLEPLLAGRLPRWILYMGEASYVLYLFHPLVAPIPPVIFSKLDLDLPFISIATSILLALAASAVIHHIVERPITSWLRPRIPFAVKKQPSLATP